MISAATKLNSPASDPLLAINLQEKMRILFVDDDTSVIGVLRAIMSQLAPKWDCLFAEGGAEALALMKEKPFNVVVSDMRMPKMNGLQLLNEILRISPRTVRIIMSGQSDEQTVQQSAGATHQWMNKPFNVVTLKKLLDRVEGTRERLGNPRFQELVGRMTHVPSVPTVYFQLLDAQQKADCTAQMIASIVARDPGLTAQLLKLVNSAFFGFGREIADVTEAVQFLGVNRIRSLTLIQHVFSKFDEKTFTDLSLDELWAQSLQTASWARQIAAWRKAGQMVQDESFTAGLLHDIGHLILAANVPDVFKETKLKALATKRPWHVVEREVFGSTHAEIGAYLLSIWGLPPALVDAVIFHEDPAEAIERSFTAATAVHLAATWSHQRSALSAKIPPPDLDETFLVDAGVANDHAFWHDRLLDA